MRIRFAARLGDVMYGLESEGSCASFAYEIKPALSLVSELSHVKQLEAGQDIGYGATYDRRTPMDWTRFLLIMRMVNWGNSFHMLIKGDYCPIGRVSMDQVTVRLPKNSPLGTKVTLIGREGEKEITQQRGCRQCVPLWEVVCLWASDSSWLIKKNKKKQVGFSLGWTRFYKRKEEKWISH